MTVELNDCDGREAAERASVTLRQVDLIQRQHSLAANLRETIFGTALDIVDAQGIEGLTQPKPSASGSRT